MEIISLSFFSLGFDKFSSLIISSRTSVLPSDKQDEVKPTESRLSRSKSKISISELSEPNISTPDFIASIDLANESFLFFITSPA